MDLTSLLSILQANMGKKRFEHTLGVSDTAAHLAEIHGADPEKARLAGLLHDACREMPMEMQREYVRQAGLNPDAVCCGIEELLHGPAAVCWARKQHGIADLEILSAVGCHSTGKAGMTVMEKILFLADFIEPGRDFEGVNRIRKKAEKDLDDALLAAFDASLLYVIKKKGMLHPETVIARNDLLKQRRLNHTSKG